MAKVNYIGRFEGGSTFFEGILVNDGVVAASPGKW